MGTILTHTTTYIFRSIGFIFGCLRQHTNILCVITSCMESYASVDPVVDLNLEAAAIIASRITQALEGARLRVFYLAEKVCYQLVGVNVPQVLMDPPEFMLAPCSMTISPTLSESQMS